MKFFLSVMSHHWNDLRTYVWSTQNVRPGISNCAFVRGNTDLTFELWTQHARVYLPIKFGKVPSSRLPAVTRC